MILSTKQETILKSAIHIFALYGKSKASMATIAKNANVSKPLLFHHYQSKETLYKKSYMYILEQFQILKKQLHPTESFIEALPNILEGKLALESKIPGIYQFYELEHPTSPTLPPHPFTPTDLKRFKKGISVDQFWKTLFYMTIGFEHALVSRKDTTLLFHEFETVYAFLLSLIIQKED